MKYWQNKLNTFEQNPECRYHTSNRTKCFIRKCIQREATLCWPPAQIWRPIWRFQFIDVIKCGREGERGFQTKLRHPTMLSQRRGHTPPKSSTPLSSQQERVPAPPHYANPPTKQRPASLPSPLSIIGCFSSEMSSLKPRVAGCWLAALPVHLPSLANGNPSHSGKGGVHSSRKQWLGEGCEFMLHIL